MTNQHGAVDIIVPVYNEQLEVVRETVRALVAVCAEQTGRRIIVVDDGSDAALGLVALRDEPGISFVQHDINRGYGAALKTGILHGEAPWIAITDADGTYPVDQLVGMIESMSDHDMVIGARNIQDVPFLRRLPKALLNRFASYMAGTRILDLNSGLRVFDRTLCEGIWGLLPAAFSFTSTLTMGATLGGYRIRYQGIDYYQREGKSSIRPIRDTLRFFFIVMRLGLLFTPMKVFGPMAAALFALGAAKGFLKDFPGQGYIGNLSVTVMLTGVQIFMMGLLGEMIVHSRNLRLRGVNRD